jgi:hypothetical protein
MGIRNAANNRMRYIWIAFRRGTFKGKDIIVVMVVFVVFG